MNLPTILTNPAIWTTIILPVVGAIVVLIVGWILARFAQTAMTRWLPRAGGSMITIAPFAGQASRYAILILALITALGFIGVMTRGMHHQDHHLMIARGEHPHG